MRVINNPGNGLFERAGGWSRLTHGDREQMFVVRHEAGPEMLKVIRGQGMPFTSLDVQKPNLRGCRTIVARARPMKTVAAVDNLFAVRREIRVVQRSIVFGQ